MNLPTHTNTPGSTVATGFGLPKKCGLTSKDETPDEEEPGAKENGTEEEDNDEDGRRDDEDDEL